MAWIEAHQSLGGHRKLRHLVRTLHISFPQAVGHLCYLWWWCIDNAPDGDLSSIQNDDIADASMWKRDCNAFVDALIDAGFIDNPGKKIHDWDDYAGKLIDKREQRRDDNREAQRRHRANLKLGQHNVITDNDDSQHPTVPNPTVPNPTNKEILKKKPYGEFKNVLLTDDELAKLKEKFNSTYQEKIEELSEALKSKKGYSTKFTDHYATILSWARRKKEAKHEPDQYKYD